MRRFVAILALLAVVFCFTACGKQEKKNLKHHKMVTAATAQLKKHWKQEYQDENKADTDGYFEITNVRVITIKENDIKLFQDVAYIVEYELYTDYYGSAPYYDNYVVDDTVVVYKNGTMDVSQNLIWKYRNTAYQTDFSVFIEDIDDYGGQYNCIEKLK